MEKKIIISKDNKKAIAVINSIRERKKALREFMLAGGSIKDFNPSKKKEIA